MRQWGLGKISRDVRHPHSPIEIEVSCYGESQLLSEYASAWTTAGRTGRKETCKRRNLCCCLRRHRQLGKRGPCSLAQIRVSVSRPRSKNRLEYVGSSLNLGLTPEEVHPMLRTAIVYPRSNRVLSFSSILDGIQMSRNRPEPQKTRSKTPWRLGGAGSSRC